jgi:tetratricopeptide (TPR) repeat protein
LLLGAVLFGATVGFCVSLWSWPRGDAGSASVEGAGGAQIPFFSDPAFSPNASAADLKRAAEQTAEELVRVLPQSPDARQVLAQTQDKLGALGSRLGQRNEGVAAAQQIALETHLRAGRCYRQHGQVEKAVEMLGKAAALGRQDVQSRTELFAIYVKAGRDRQALEVCRQLSRIEPEQGDHWLNLALLRTRLDDLEGAKSALKRALEIDPGNARYRKFERLLEETE